MDFETTLDLQSLIELLKNYDFINNSVRKFSLEHKISEKTITKHLRNNNIEYSKRIIKYNIPRDRNGKFVIENKLIVNDDHQKINKRKSRLSPIQEPKDCKGHSDGRSPCRPKGSSPANQGLAKSLGLSLEGRSEAARPWVEQKKINERLIRKNFRG